LADLPLLELMEQQQLLTMGCQRLRAGLGDLEAQSKLRDALADSTSKVRAEAARGLGMSRNKEWVSDLERMGDDPAPEVVAAALIGRVQLGDGRAVSDLKEILANPEQTAQRTATVKALCSAASDNNVVSYIESAMLTSIGPEKLSVEVTLRMRGDLSIGQDLRNVLGDEVDLADRLFLVQALAENSAHEDLALFEDLFPSQRFPGVNLDLAIALARGGAPEGIDILRKALWSGPMDRSLLAASVLIQHGGLKSIVSELESTPLGVTADALRRVGYALGIFGGLDELDRLRRRRGTSDAALQGAYLGALAARTM
jgi:HEAT repeat protein